MTNGWVASFATFGGAFTWVASEYLLHRFVGHGAGRSGFAREHRQHHARGNYFAPSWKKVVVVTPVFLTLAVVATWLVGMGIGIPYVLGAAGMYLGYEVFHRRLHTHPPRGRVGRWVRRHHFFHHFHEPAKNHGVTLPLFDRLAGTLATPVGRLRVPERLAMPWLVEPETGLVRAEFRDDYELIPLRR